MATIYINATTGSDTTGTGAIGAPYASISKFNSVYNSGDICYLQDSTAHYSFVSLTWTKACTIQGQSKEGVILNGNGGVVGWKVQNVEVTVKFLTIYNAYTTSGGTTGYGMFNNYSSTDDTTINLEDIVFRDCFSANHTLAGIISSFAIPAGKVYTVNFKRIKIINLKFTGTNSILFSFRTGAVATFIFNVEDVTVDINPNGYVGYFYYLDNLGLGTVNQNVTRSIFTNRTATTLNWRNIFGTSTWTVTDTTFYGITNLHSSITSQSGVSQADPLLVDPDNENFNLRQDSPLL